MPRRARLDVELVRRGLAPSREQAARLVLAGRVAVRGAVAVKPATAVDLDAPLVVVVAAAEQGPAYASRGGHKLAGALDRFTAGGLAVAGRRCLDAGASTGGFTDVLLRRGAGHVVAVDVGYGQLAWALRTDRRVRVLDRTNVRSLSVEAAGGPVDLVVADLSFIPLGVVLPALGSLLAPGGDLVPMVKPQFEVGRERLGRGGVVREPADRLAALGAVAAAAARLGLGTRDAVASPLPGPSGNVEYFLWLRADAPAPDERLLRRAVEEGPA